MVKQASWLLTTLLCGEWNKIDTVCTSFYISRLKEKMWNLLNDFASRYFIKKNIKALFSTTMPLITDVQGSPSIVLFRTKYCKHITFLSRPMWLLYHWWSLDRMVSLSYHTCCGMGLSFCGLTRRTTKVGS